MKKMYGKVAAIFLAFFSALLILIPVFAQQPTPSDDQVNALAKEMYCPVCENTPLDVCPTQACAQWRDLIRQKMALGWSDQQIKDYFVAQYGDRVLAEPPARGLNWLVYILPPVLFGVAAYILFRIYRKMQPQSARAKDIEPNGLESPTDPYVNRMEEEYNRFNKS
jgi:cytochrome c-type biogenesis protein CcmH